MHIIFCFGKRNTSFLKCLQTSELVRCLRRTPLDGCFIRSPLEQDTEQCHCKPASITHTDAFYIRRGDQKHSASTANTTVHASSCAHSGAGGELSAPASDWGTVPFHLSFASGKWCDPGTMGNRLGSKPLTSVQQWAAAPARAKDVSSVFYGPPLELD